MVRSRRAFISWTSPHKGSRRRSSRNPREVESSPVQTEELRGQEDMRNKFQSRRLRVSQGFTYSRDPEISSTRKVSPSVHWTIPSAKESRKSSLPTPTTRRNVRHTPGVPCLIIKKVLECTRDRTRASGSNKFAARPAIPGSTGQNSGHCHKKNKELRSTDLQSAMEQTWSRRSYMGTRRCSEEGVSPSL